MADKAKSEIHTFNMLFTGMGLLLLGIAGWIAASVAHIPSIDQKLEDFIKTATSTFSDHETRIRNLEGHK